MKIWYNYDSVKHAVDTITYFHKAHKKVPEILTTAYRETLKRTSKGLVIRFYELLVKQCPEELKFYIDVIEEKKEG